MTDINKKSVFDVYSNIKDIVDKEQDIAECDYVRILQVIEANELLIPDYILASINEFIDKRIVPYVYSGHLCFEHNDLDIEEMDIGKDFDVICNEVIKPYLLS